MSERWQLAARVPMADALIALWRPRYMTDRDILNRAVLIAVGKMDFKTAKAIRDMR